MSMLVDYPEDSTWHKNETFKAENELYSNNLIVKEEATNNDTIEPAAQTKSILAFLLETAPESVKMVPSHWLEQILPPAYGQLSLSIAFMIIGIPSHLCHLLVFLTFAR